MPEIQKLDSFPKIVADCFIPLGRACRPAKWLKTHNLRYCSLPFDWFMNFSLEAVLSVLINSVSSTFIEYREEPEKAEKHRYITELKTGTVFMHDFPLEKEMKDYVSIFEKNIERRCERMRKILKNYRNICFICNRNEDISVFSDFISKMLELYPKLKINFVNIRHSKDSKVILYKVSKDSVIYDICMNDIHKNGCDKKNNPAFWLGNEDLWNKICFNFSLSKKIKNQLNKNTDIDFALEHHKSFGNSFFK